MGFLKNQILKQLDAVKANVSEERIEELEAQGYDMSEYRAALNAKKAEQKAANAEHEEFIKNLRDKHQNLTDLKKLEPYVKTPRSIDTPFFMAVAGKAPFFGKSKWRATYSEGPIVYEAILDCPDELLAPSTNDEGYYCISLYAIDRSEEHTSELQSRQYLVCRLL